MKDEILGLVSYDDALVALEHELPESVVVDEGLKWGERGQYGQHLPGLAAVQGKFKVRLGPHGKPEVFPNCKGIYHSRGRLLSLDDYH